MSDVMPKVKLYILISIFQLIINIGAWVFTINENIDNFLLSFGASVGEAFLPIVSLVSLGFMNLPSILTIIIGIFTGIFSGIQIFIMLMISFQIVSNLIWHPDV